MSFAVPQIDALEPIGGEMGRLLRERDWSRTALGPMETWPACLRVALDICLSSRFPMFVWWGPTLINFYNDAYIPILGKRHPSTFGESAPAIWAEIWDVIGPEVEAVMQRGHATWNERVLLMVERNGYTEEAYFTWSYSPIRDDDRRIRGLFCAVVEDTSRVLVARERDRLSRELRQALEAARMGWWRYDARTRQITLDARAADLMGSQPGTRSVDDDIAPRVHPDDMEALGAAYLAALDPADPKPLTVQYRIMMPDGSIRWIDTHALLDTDKVDANAGPRLLGAVTDITARKRDEERLRTSEERFALAVDAGELGTFYCPLPMGPIIWNDKCKEHFWLPPDAEVDFDRFYALMHPDDREPTRRAIERTVHDREPYDVVYRTVAPDGRERWVRAKGRAYYDAEGKPTRFDGITLDVTEQMRIDAETREREARMRELADAMPQIVWSSRSDGTPEYLNRRWYEYTGLTPGGGDDLRYSRSVLDEEGMRVVEAAWRLALRTEQPFEAEYRLRRSDGVYRWHLGRSLPIRDLNGNVKRWYGTATDIDDAKRAETLLRESEQRYRLATRATADTIWDWTFATDEVRWNESITSMFGYRPDVIESTQEWWTARVHPEDRPRVLGRIEAAIADRNIEVWQDEYRFARADEQGDVPDDAATARYADVLDRGFVLRDESGAGVRMIGSMQDLSARKAMERDRESLLQAERAARAEAERVSQMKDEFLATLSHELRTPLNAMLGWAQLLRRAGSEGALSDPGEVTQGLEVIERNARAQSKIIEDLLDMSRIISGKVRIDLAFVDLAAIVAGAVETAQPAADAKEVRLDFSGDLSRDDAAGSQAPLSLGSALIRGDASRLQQVLWNLLSNAIKFTPRGGAVTVRLHREQDELRVRIADTGEGISADFLPHVFDRFRQADASTTRRHGGLGLGLSIVKQLVELHGGRVSVASDGVGHGATFIITLPASEPSTPRAAARGAVAPVSASPQPSAATSTAAAGRPDDADVGGLRVLIVDDDADARRLIERLLQGHGATVTSAESAQAALDRMADTERFDVIVSDIGMPHDDGFDLLRRVRALPTTRGGATPAIALTAYAHDRDRTRATAAGFAVHVAKPVDPTELLTAIARAAGRLA